MWSTLWDIWLWLSDLPWLLVAPLALLVLWAIGAQQRLRQHQRAAQACWLHWLQQQHSRLHLLHSLPLNHAKPQQMQQWNLLQTCGKQYTHWLNQTAKQRKAWHDGLHRPGKALFILDTQFEQHWQTMLRHIPLNQPTANPQHDAAEYAALALEALLDKPSPKLHTVLHLEHEARLAYIQAAQAYSQQRELGPTPWLACVLRSPYPVTLTGPAQPKHHASHTQDTATAAALVPLETDDARYAEQAETEPMCYEEEQKTPAHHTLKSAAATSAPQRTKRTRRKKDKPTARSGQT